MYSCSISRVLLRAFVFDAVYTRVFLNVRSISMYNTVFLSVQSRVYLIFIIVCLFYLREYSILVYTRVLNKRERSISLYNAVFLY